MNARSLPLSLNIPKIPLKVIFRGKWQKKPKHSINPSWTTKMRLTVRRIFMMGRAVSYGLFAAFEIWRRGSELKAADSG